MTALSFAAIIIAGIASTDVRPFAMKSAQAAGYTLEQIQATAAHALMTTAPAALAAEGEAIERKHFKDIRELLGVTTREMVIGGHRVPVANLPYTMSSDAGHELAKGRPFAACYWDTPEGRVFSLRSSDDGMDVAEVAKQYGGGGHRNASGFRVSFVQAQAFEV